MQGERPGGEPFLGDPALSMETEVRFSTGFEDPSGLGYVMHGGYRQGTFATGALACLTRGVWYEHDTCGQDTLAFCDDHRSSTDCFYLSVNDLETDEERRTPHGQ